MTTRDISFPDGRPVTDRPDAAPGPLVPAAQEANASPKRPFAAVIEHAMRRRPASSRSARTTPHQRDAGEPASPARARGLRLQKLETGKPAAPNGQPVSVDPTAETSRPAESDGNVSPTSAAEDNAPTSLEDTAPVQDRPGESVLPDGVPQNIVLFPTPSVIIPFPLAEAKAKSASSRAVEIPTLGEAAGAELPLNVQRSTFNAERSMAAADGFSNKAGANVSSAPTEGVDIAKLGLTAVEDSDNPENVHPVDFGKSADDSATRSEPAIISVSFRPAQSVQPADPATTDERQAAQTQLPGQTSAAEESAPMIDSTAPAGEAHPKPLNPTKAPRNAEGGTRNAEFRALRSPLRVSTEATGISAARQESRMESMTSSKQPDALIGREPAARQATGALEESPVAAAESSRDGGDILNFSARNLSATEWQTGRPVSSSDRPASDSLNTRPADTTGMVERVSKLVLGEVALIKQHSSDSMAVVLRPDAETELFVHLTLRDGQIEATVRCERGDLQHLGALWGQLQESLAQQKVRLAPLQESPSNTSNFNQSAGPDTNSSGHGSPRHSQREGPQPDKQFMDEWPTPASSSTDPAHVRGRGGSRHRRLTTSRPGWETWA